MTQVSEIALRVAEETAQLPVEKQRSILNFVLFVKQQQGSELVPDGDAEWDRIISDPKPKSKLEAFAEVALAEGSQPLDLDKM